MATGWELLAGLILRHMRRPKRERYMVGRNGEKARARRRRQIEKGILRIG